MYQGLKTLLEFIKAVTQTKSITIQNCSRYGGLSNRNDQFDEEDTDKIRMIRMRLK